MAESNIAMIMQVAHALGKLKDKVVFVGGSVAELYADFPEIADIRPTLDVDCIVDTKISSNYTEYAKLEAELRKLGFQDDTSKNAPICRKIYKGIVVDFMPVDPNILGFSNSWYSDGINSKILAVLPNGTTIYILPVEYYLATKLEAMKSRGGTDLRGSHDWEDVVYLLNNYSKLTDKIKQCGNANLVNYLKDELGKLLKDSNIHEIIYSALPFPPEEENINEILETMIRIAE